MYCKCYEKVIEEYEAEDIKLLNKAKELATIHHEGQTANMEKC
jgi:hypothetical protein